MFGKSGYGNMLTVTVAVPLQLPVVTVTVYVVVAYTVAIGSATVLSLRPSIVFHKYLFPEGPACSCTGEPAHTDVSGTADAVPPLPVMVTVVVCVPPPMLLQGTKPLSTTVTV